MIHPMISMCRAVRATCMMSLLITLAGCAKTPNVALDPAFWHATSPKTVVLTLAPAPKPELDRKGPQAVAGLVSSRVATARFAWYLRKYKAPDMAAVQAQWVNILQQNHIPAHLDGTVSQSNIYNQQRLILTIKKLGAQRKYFGLFPTGAPIAFCVAEGTLIDGADQRVLWQFDTRQEVQVEGNWDQPPTYPGFTAALNTALNQCMHALQQNFSVHAP